MSQAIPLTQGKVAIVDDADYEWLSAFRWYAVNKGRGRFYAARQTLGPHSQRRRIFMHQALCLPRDGLIPDHVNGDGLDNRQANLRLATWVENARNRRRVSKPGRTSQFKGVRFVPRQTVRPWRAAINVSGHRVELGSFVTEAEAAEAYDAAALKLFGSFAVLNFPRATLGRAA